MTPQEIILAEYGRSVNIITPTILEIGALPEGAYELSSGRGLNDEPIYGVSVVYVKDGSTDRSVEDSRLFHSVQEARGHIESLRSRA